jgi:hypothetical protein
MSNLESKGWDMFKKILFAGVGACFCVTVSAAEEIYIEEELPLVWSKIITLSAGPVWATGGQDLALIPITPPLFGELHTNTSDTSLLGSGEIFFGLQRFYHPCWIGQLGIGVAGTSDADVTGVANVNGIPNVYSYEYKVNHVRIELKGKLIAEKVTWIQPYVSGSFGVGYNNSHYFESSPVNEFLFPAHHFENNTVWGFAYTVGAGVQKMVNPNWQIGVGYEFADWGKSNLGGNGLNFGKGPELTHFYTHELLFSLSYLYS